MDGTWHILFHRYKKYNLQKQYFIAKMDIEKAYDHVSWSFIDVVLIRMGFSWHWIDLNIQCVTSYSIFFKWWDSYWLLGKVTRYHHLFTISQALTFTINYSVSLAKLKGFHLSKMAQPITHFICGRQDDFWPMYRISHTRICFHLEAISTYFRTESQYIQILCQCRLDISKMPTLSLKTWLLKQ